MSAPSYRVTKRFCLSSLHFLHNPNYSEAENRRVFGKCYRTHGHDFRIEVTIQGMPEKTSGWSIDRQKLENIVNERIIIPYTGKKLNDFFPNPSGEGLSVAFYKILKEDLGDALYCVSIEETPKNYFSYSEPK